MQSSIVFIVVIFLLSSCQPEKTKSYCFKTFSIEYLDELVIHVIDSNEFFHSVSLTIPDSTSNSFVNIYWSFKEENLENVIESHKGSLNRKFFNLGYRGPEYTKSDSRYGQYNSIEVKVKTENGKGKFHLFNEREQFFLISIYHEGNARNIINQQLELTVDSFSFIKDNTKE